MAQGTSMAVLRKARPGKALLTTSAMIMPKTVSRNTDTTVNSSVFDTAPHHLGSCKKPSATPSSVVNQKLPSPRKVRWSGEVRLASNSEKKMVRYRGYPATSTMAIMVGKISQMACRARAASMPRCRTGAAVGLMVVMWGLLWKSWSGACRGGPVRASRLNAGRCLGGSV